MSSESKKRRRSSLCSRKIKIQLTAGAGKGIHEHVDASMSPEDRLAELTKLSIQNSVDTVRDGGHSQHSDAVHDCLDKVSSSIPAVLLKPDVREMIQASCFKSSLLPNPENIAMDSTIEDIQGQISRLKKEENDWREYFADLRNQVAQAEKRLETSEITENDLTEEQREGVNAYLPKMADLTVVKEQVQTARNKTFILMNQLSKNQRKMEKAIKHMEKKLENKNIHLEETPWIQQTGTPRTNLKNIIELPNPVCTGKDTIL